MKLIVDRATFGNRLKLAMSAVKARTPIHQLQCVHGVAKRRSLEIHATDGEVGVRIPCESVDVIEDGEFLVNADRLSSIVSVDGSQTVTIESDAERGVARLEDKDGHRYIVWTGDAFGKDDK